MTPLEILHNSYVDIITNILNAVVLIIPVVGGAVAFFITLKVMLGLTYKSTVMEVMGQESPGEFYDNASDETLMDLASKGDSDALEEIDSRQFPHDHDLLYQDGKF